MKTLVRIPSILRDIVGASIFSALATIYPEGVVRPHAFQAFLIADDVRMQQIRSVLEEAGFRPWTDKSRLPYDSSEYTLYFEHQYDPADFDGTQFLKLAPPEDACTLAASTRHPDNSLVILEHMLPDEDFDFLASSYSFFVPLRVKTILESSGLIGMRFLRPRFAPRDMKLGDTAEMIEARRGIPYWELDSDRRMPPLAPSVTLVNMDGVPLPPGSEGPGFPKEGLYINPQLHYRASDVSKHEPFDIARTYERYQAFGAPGDRPLIVSKRFYQFCLQNGLKGGWEPVQIDPD